MVTAMADFRPGLVHTPITPFTAAHEVDFEAFAKLLEFHIANGADSLALPMHAAESVSLTDEEKRELLSFALKHAAGRVPVIAHASDSGTAIAASFARYAQDAGAAAVVSTAPYYWTPPPAMVLEHFAQIGSAVSIPFCVYSAPEDMAGAKVTTELTLALLKRLDNFRGVVDASHDWQFMIDVSTDAPRARPEFQLISGTEYMVSAAAIGAGSLFSPLAGVAPRLVRQLYELCADQKLFEARNVQEELAALRQLIKRSGIAGLRAAMAAMGRACGAPRPPLESLEHRAADLLHAQLGALRGLSAEPRGW
jgi:4-hydroxy-tetrahydrodipicolinate synthase